MSSYQLTIPDVPPSLNRVLRMHWTSKRELGEDWQKFITLALLENRIWLRTVQANGRKLKVKVTLHNARQFDKDNAYGACKVVFDALKKVGLIHDDRAEFLEASVEQQKCKRKEKRTVIEIGEAAT